MHDTRLRFLVVDDDPDVAHTLADGLELCGEIAYAAHDAFAALQLTEAFAPEVALLDLRLPDLDGFELARLLRERHGKELALIAISGFGDDENRRRATSAGFHAFFTKPVALDQIRQAARELTARPRERSGPDPSVRT